MTVRYADPAGSNTAPYDTWAKAATSGQTIIDLATAGDKNYYRGTFNESWDIDTNSGDLTNGDIYHVGCAADGTVDGTRAVVDGQSTRANCIKTLNKNQHQFSNFTFQNATGVGVNYSGGGDRNVFINCLIQNNGSYGLQGVGSAYYNYFLFCQMLNNTSHGVYRPGIGSKWFGCVLVGNGGHGFHCDAVTSAEFIRLIFHDNGDAKEGIFDFDLGCLIMECSFDGTDQNNAGGLKCNATHTNPSLIIMNRFTNLNIGIDMLSELARYGWNYFHNNTTDTQNDSYLTALTYKTETDSNKSDVDADDGYNDVSSDDFNLKESRTYSGDGNDIITVS